MENAVDPYDADQDEIDRDNIVQQSRHQQSQRSANDGNERHHVMDDGGHPHCEVSPLGLMSAGGPQPAHSLVPRPTFDDLDVGEPLDWHGGVRLVWGTEACQLMVAGQLTPAS
jgi:hypothetical protein